MFSNTPNTLIPLKNVANGQIGMIVNPEADREIMHRMVAWLAQKGQVSVIDCGCRFNASRVMELIHLESIFFQNAMRRIQVARAFTAYQLTTLLEQTSASHTPLIVMHPLNLIYDENISLSEGTRLFSLFINHLTGFSQQRMVIVCVRPPAAEFKDRLGLLHRLTKTADQLITPQITEKRGEQLTLWDDLNPQLQTNSIS